MGVAQMWDAMKTWKALEKAEVVALREEKADILAARRTAAGANPPGCRVSALASIT